MIQNSPNNHCISIDFVVDILMETVGKCAIVAKVDFTGSRVIHKVVYFTEYVILKPDTQAIFDIVIEATHPDNIDNGRWED